MLNILLYGIRESIEVWDYVEIYPWYLHIVLGCKNNYRLLNKCALLVKAIKEHDIIDECYKVSLKIIFIW